MTLLMWIITAIGGNIFSANMGSVNCNHKANEFNFKNKQGGI